MTALKLQLNLVRKFAERHVRDTGKRAKLVRNLGILFNILSKKGETLAQVVEQLLAVLKVKSNERIVHKKHFKTYRRLDVEEKKS